MSQKEPIHEKRAGSYPFLIPALILAVSLVTTMAGWQVLKNQIQDRAKIKFENLVKDTQLLIKERINLYIDTLYGLEGLFAASQHVDPEEWKQYIEVTNIYKRYPGIVAMRYIERTQDPGVAGKESYRVRYVEPETGNEKMIGLDVSGEANRLEALEYARDTGKPSLTRRITLNIDTENEAGLLLSLPIYKNGEQHDTVDSRRAALAGFVDVAFRTRDLLREIFGNQSVHPNIDFEILDSNLQGEDEILYDDDSVFHLHDSKFQARFKASETLKIGNRSWSLHFFALPGFGLNPMEDMLPWIELAGGIALSFALFWIIFLLNTSRSKALKLAETMTQELRAREKSQCEMNEKLNLTVGELGQRNRDFATLSEMGELLQACASPEEAYRVVGKFTQKLFPHFSEGTLYMINSSNNLMEEAAHWGPADSSPNELFSAGDCWALRKGKIHAVQHSEAG